jgi:hypothetical protein
MNMLSCKHVFLSVVIIFGLVMMVGPVNTFAQSSEPGDLNAAPRALRNQLFNGGAFQVLDIAAPPCDGRCAVANWQTATCSCPSGFAAFQAARILIDVTGGQCGSTLYICGRP